MTIRAKAIATTGFAVSFELAPFSVARVISDSFLLSIVDAAFGTATADIKTACSGYSKCVDEKCPAGQTLSYASGVVYEVDCGMTMPTARSRKYPKAFSAVGDGTVAEAGSTNKPGSGAASTKISTITLLSSIVIGIAVLL